MQISRFNRAAPSKEVSFFLDRQEGTIIARAPAPSDFLDFSRIMASKRGRAQRTLGLYLSTKLNGCADPDAPLKTFAKRQIGEVSSHYFPEARFIPGFNLESFWISPPYAMYSAAPADFKNLKDLSETIADLSFKILSKSVLLVGQAGAGKTAALFRVFSKTIKHYQDKKIDIFPVFVPATSLRFSKDNPYICWDSLPGAPSLCPERLETLMREGKLFLFIDGLDEKIESARFENPSVAEFWRLMGKNRCLISCRDRFLAAHIKTRCLQQAFSNHLSIIELLEWSGSHIQEFYLKLEKRFKTIGLEEERKMMGRLGALREAELEQRLHNRRTAWSVWLYALNCLNSKREPNSQNEYELLDFMVTKILDWETGKPGNILHTETAKGLLSHLAWQSYLDGNYGESWTISLEKAWEITFKRYPLFEGKRSELFASLNRIPLLDYNGETATIAFDPRFAGFLAAQRFLNAARNGNAFLLEEMCQEPIAYPIVIYAVQGIEAMSLREKERFFHLGQDIFEKFHADFKRQPRWRLSIGMHSILEYIGHVHISDSARFLWTILNKANSYPPIVVRSSAIGLAHAKDEKAMPVFINWLESSAEARKINRNFPLYFLGDSRAPHGSEDPLKRLKVERWDKTCDWLLRILHERYFSPELPLYLYTFYDLIRTHGLSPFQLDQERARRRHNLIESLNTLKKIVHPSSLEIKWLQKLQGAAKAIITRRKP